MNKVVRAHVPARELPESLREGIALNALVTVTVEEEEKLRDRESLLAMIAAARRDNSVPGVSTEEAVARIRALRDEWDDRN